MGEEIVGKGRGIRSPAGLVRKNAEAKSENLFDAWRFCGVELAPGAHGALRH